MYRATSVTKFKHNNETLRKNIEIGWNHDIGSLSSGNDSEKLKRQKEVIYLRKATHRGIVKGSQPEILEMAIRSRSLGSYFHKNFSPVSTGNNKYQY